MPFPPSHSNIPCPSCHGLGFVEVADGGFYEPHYRKETCDRCYGARVVDGSPSDRPTFVALESGPRLQHSGDCDCCPDGDAIALLDGQALCEACYGDQSRGVPGAALAIDIAPGGDGIDIALARTGGFRDVEDETTSRLRRTSSGRMRAAL